MGPQMNRTTFDACPARVLVVGAQPDADTLQLESLWPVRPCANKDGVMGWAVHAYNSYSRREEAGVWRPTQIEALRDRDAVADAFVGEGV
jgi:hypothetical protein